jgi:hypothetical protein
LWGRNRGKSALVLGARRGKSAECTGARRAGENQALVLGAQRQGKSSSSAGRMKRGGKSALVLGGRDRGGKVRSFVGRARREKISSECWALMREIKLLCWARETGKIKTLVLGA